MLQPIFIPAMEFLHRLCQEHLFFIYFWRWRGSERKSPADGSMVFSSTQQPPEHVRSGSRGLAPELGLSSPEHGW